MRQRHVLDAERHDGSENGQKQQLADDAGRKYREPRKRLKSRPDSKPMQPSATNCTAVRASTSWKRENFETNTMCTANKTAHSSVITSPKPMFMPPDWTDTSQIPTKASTAAPMLNTVGRLWATIHHKKGTITQYVAVRNALMPGVVCSKPTVCVQNARKSARPSTVPASTILPLNALANTLP